MVQEAQVLGDGGQREARKQQVNLGACPEVRRSVCARAYVDAVKDQPDDGHVGVGHLLARARPGSAVRACARRPYRQLSDGGGALQQRVKVCEKVRPGDVLRDDAQRVQIGAYATGREIGARARARAPPLACTPSR